MPYENSSISDAAADEYGNVYILVTVENDDAYLTDMDIIYEYDSTGNFVCEVGRFDYTEDETQPHRTSNVNALNVYDGKLRFIYNDEPGRVVLLSCESNTSVMKTECYADISEYSSVYSVNACKDGTYIAVLTDGSIVIIESDGKVNTVCKSDFNLNDGGFLPYSAAKCGKSIYIAEGFDGRSIYSLTDDDNVLYISADEITDDEYAYFASVSDYNDTLAFILNDTVYINENDEYIPVYGGYTLPIEYMAAVFVRMISPFLAGIFLLLGIISIIGNIFSWRLTIMAKQIFMTVPVVLAIFCAVVVGMLKDIYDTYDKDTEQLMTAINELAVKTLDGDEIEKMTSLDYAKDGSLYKLHKTLEDIINSNKDTWNKNFDCSVYLYSEDGIYSGIAYSNNYAMPFQTYSYGNDELVNSAENDSDTVIAYMNTLDTKYMIADTPIYNSDEEQVAIFELSADLSTISENIIELIKKAALHIAMYIPFLIAAVVIVSYVSVKYLRKASCAVLKISNGDFTARIDKSPKDEVGEICNGVNNMANQLEIYFEQKDKNERFYYKFVPEKFKELLHKSDFTELSLGDAESVDLTVLFCDIRSFSLNSEMMTAKENFEFVNIIYGKAGPIIRSHNGFVDKYIGDAVMALFENADDAVAAGIELYREIAINPETAEMLGVSSINIGVGIHSGMARIGIVGENERMSGTVISNTVNLSSRLESLTKKYNTGMIISKDTLDRMSDPDSYNTRYLGMIQVAGVNEVKALYEVLDCLDDTRKNERTSTKSSFREAVRLFHLGNLKGSLEIFENIGKISSNDPAIEMYSNTIKEKLETGDYEHNVFRFTKK